MLQRHVTRHFNLQKMFNISTISCFKVP